MEGVGNDKDEDYNDSNGVLSKVKKKPETSTPDNDIAEFLEQLNKESRYKADW